MKTKDLIKDQSRILFNEKGVMNLTLRDVADKLGKSYGNITYHFPTKVDLIKELFEEMNAELFTLQNIPDQKNLLVYFLELPNFSFDITLKYLFFYVDFIELKRNYPDFFKTVDQLNEKRRESWLGLLQLLKDQGYLANELSDSDLEYIMFLSASVRTFYWQVTDFKSFNRRQYCQTVNALLKPYLSSEGLAVFEGMNSQS